MILASVSAGCGPIAIGIAAFGIGAIHGNRIDPFVFGGHFERRVRRQLFGVERPARSFENHSAITANDAQIPDPTADSFQNPMFNFERRFGFS
jgi:hypothetical protein